MKQTSTEFRQPGRGTVAARVGLLAALLAWPAAAAMAAEKPVEPAEGTGSRIMRALDGFLPTAWQKRPTVRFNVITEMTPEGRRRRVPTPEQPMYYHSPEPKFVQAGWLVSAGERPPPIAELLPAMQKALSENGYLPMPEPPPGLPDVLVVFTFGSHGTDPTAGTESDAVNAAELAPLVLSDPGTFRDVVERATFVAGEKFARELKRALDEEVRNMRFNQSFARNAGDLPPPAPVSPDSASPLNIFMQGGTGGSYAHFTELAFRTCYYVMASAYDFQGVAKKQRILLWQTRMAVEAQGVSMREILKPLLINTGGYIGRETPEAVILKKQIDREGQVKVGTATVVEDPKPANPPDPITPGRKQ
jgi:hypothetical protein